MPCAAGRGDCLRRNGTRAISHGPLTGLWWPDVDFGKLYRNCYSKGNLLLCIGVHRDRMKNVTPGVRTLLNHFWSKT